MRRGRMEKHVKSAKFITYPAVADSVDLPDFTFRKNKDENAFRPADHG